MLKLEEILRASYINRWTMVNTCQPQSVAEHSFNVCMIARALCKRLNIGDMAITKAALEHDLDEVLHGDIPTPTKRKMKENGVDLNEHLSKEMRELSDMQQAVLKVSDMLEAELFLWDHGIGNHSRTVHDGIVKDLNEYIDGKINGVINEQIMRNFVREVRHERKDI